MQDRVGNDTTPQHNGAICVFLYFLCIVPRPGTLHTQVETRFARRGDLWHSDRTAGAPPLPPAGLRGARPAPTLKHRFSRAGRNLSFSLCNCFRKCCRIRLVMHSPRPSAKWLQYSCDYNIFLGGWAASGSTRVNNGVWMFWDSNINASQTQDWRESKEVSVIIIVFDDFGRPKHQQKTAHVHQ